MTDATVSDIRENPGKAAKGSTMTNATVAEVQKGGTGETLALDFQGGKATVLVPPGTPVVRMSPGQPSDLVPGTHVFAGVSRDRDGTLLARRVTFGKEIAPPM
jgi:hypothetical protein